MSWASRRQSQYIFGLLAVLGIIAFLIALPTITKKPTCMDGKQNGGENGVDCGGVCQRICSADVVEPLVLWSRAFPVTGSIYNLVGFVENRNKEAGIARISYEFRIYDTNNLLIGRRVGSTFVPPNQQFAVFESRFDSGASTIKSVTFDFTPPFVWLKKKPTIQTLPIKVEDIILGTDVNAPTLSARINNESIYDLPAFDVIAILYDAEKIAINASKTYKEGLASNQSGTLLFTWPKPFTEIPATREIIPMINPFETSF